MVPPSLLVPFPPVFKSLCLEWALGDRVSLGKPFSPPLPSLFLTTEASRLGWGAFPPPLVLRAVGLRQLLGFSSFLWTSEQFSWLSRISRMWFWVSPFFFARTSRLWSLSSFFREIYFPCLFVDWLWIFGGGVFLVRFSSSLPSSRKEVSSVNPSFQREVKPSLSLGFEVSVFQRFLPSGVPPPPLRRLICLRLSSSPSFPSFMLGFGIL